MPSFFSRITIKAALLLIALSLPFTPAQAARKAFIVGINQYDNLDNLQNAQQDARDLSARLTALGFDTTLVENGNKRSILRQLAAFTNNLKGAEAALFYFAGHGMHNQGTNWLIPGDALLQDESDLEVDGLNAEMILKRIADAGPDMTIMLLDACRDNPLGRRSRSLSRGLGLVNLPGGANGTLVGYAAGIGEVAMDAGRSGRNGLYTGALLKALDEPGLTIEQVMKRVRAEVSRQSGGQQSPWTLASINGDFVFNRAASYTEQPQAIPALSEQHIAPYPGKQETSLAQQQQPAFSNRQWTEARDAESRRLLQNLDRDLPYRNHDHDTAQNDGFLKPRDIARYWYSSDGQALRVQLQNNNMHYIHLTALPADTGSQINNAVALSKQLQAERKPKTLTDFMNRLMAK